MFRRIRRPSRLVPLLLVALAACAPEAPGTLGFPGTEAFPSSWRYREPIEPATGNEGAVASTDAYATQVGINLLRNGGNAIDAAVGVAFALAVVNPEAGNIGGGGFLVARTSDGTNHALDFREKAPLAAHRDMYLDAAGELTDKSLVGHLAAGVPGSVMGLWVAHQRLGTLPWEEVVEPAIALADGFEVRERQGNSLRDAAEILSRFEETRRVFLPGGAAPAIGDTFRQPDLAATLRRIRDEGPDGFYRGETADLIVAEMERGGGIITHEDLERYDAVWRDPVVFPYRGHTIISMPPSSSGGATLGAILRILEPFELGEEGWHSPRQIHLFAEAARRGYADRNELLADSDFHPVPVATMIDARYGIERGEGISMERATPSAEVGPGAGGPEESEQTTHLSVVDGAGNAVSITTTINSWYGSTATVSGAGFLLNNEMDDFAALPGTANQFGLVQGELNAIEPEKRMLSAMTPTVVLDESGALRMVVGTPGGSTIITTVLQVISNVVDHGMSLPLAVQAPRIHHQHLPDQIHYEQGGLDPETVTALEALGHTMAERSGISGDVQAILIDSDGTRIAVTDPRRGGTALAY